MEFKFNETTLLEDKKNAKNDTNSYMILAKSPEVKDSDIRKIIEIIDESGEQVSCTYDRFIEIFDEQGLSGFIM